MSACLLFVCICKEVSIKGKAAMGCGFLLCLCFSFRALTALLFASCLLCSCSLSIKRSVLQIYSSLSVFPLFPSYTLPWTFLSTLSSSFLSVFHSLGMWFWVALPQRDSRAQPRSGQSRGWELDSSRAR